MIRMIQSISVAQAKSYFSDALSRSDYYIDGQELAGRFFGKLASRMGLGDKASKEAFHALCENLHPVTGKPLTPRNKEKRTVGYDINFHCPKSVSILHMLAKDDHILKAFEASIRETMADIETDAQTRIRKTGQCHDRTTGELLWGEFIHQTARPVENFTPDPHLHSHCFVFNVTWDDAEKQYKAGQFRDMKRDMSYYQGLFHKKLSDNLVKLGYATRKTDKSFEIENVPQNVIALFSKRTDEIGRVAKDHGITDAKKLSELGARTRAKKQKGLTMPELKTEWKNQIAQLGSDNEERKPVRFGTVKQNHSLKAEDFIEATINHCFERASVMPERRLLAYAFSQAIGYADTSENDIIECFRRDDRILHVVDKGQSLCTTREVLLEEKRMVDLARSGQDKLRPLFTTAPAINLSGQQLAAVTHLLTTPHQVSIIRGAAGSGKTTLMKDAVAWMKSTGKKVMVVAPTSQASRGVLRQEGFENAETIAQLLIDPKMQDALQDQILWVDEAGLLGTKEMVSILELVTQRNARLILGGDTRQHSSVLRGDALRILNTVGGIKSAEVSKIYRQKTEYYRHVVENLSKGNVKAGFEQLDKLEWIHSVDPLNPHEKLVEDYYNAIKKRKSTLVISPTHKQGDEVTEAIRKKLRASGLIGKKEIAVTRLMSQNFTESQKADWRNYYEGQIIQFNQNMPGKIIRGSIWSVDEIADNKIFLKSSAGKIATLPTAKTSTFDVYKKAEIKLSKGDKIYVTKNSFDQQKKRLNNGHMLEVTSVTTKGNIKLRNNISKASYTLNKDFGHFAHAHCITSHSSQGKTVDEVFICQPASTFSATDAKQFYVSVSRARDKAFIYTDDKEGLFLHASEIGDRQSAIEIILSKKDHMYHVQNMQRQEPTRSPPIAAAKQIPLQIMDVDYEP